MNVNSTACTCRLVRSKNAFARGHNPLSNIAQLLLLLWCEEWERVRHLDSKEIGLGNRFI